MPHRWSNSGGDERPLRHGNLAAVAGAPDLDLGEVLSRSRHRHGEGAAAAGETGAVEIDPVAVGEHGGDDLAIDQDFQFHWRRWIGTIHHPTLEHAASQPLDMAGEHAGDHRLRRAAGESATNGLELIAFLEARGGEAMRRAMRVQCA